MRYRRFGQSELEVSEVGFGIWTLASDWWGKVDDKAGLLHAALDAGINFIDTAPGLRQRRLRRDAARRRAEGRTATRSCSPRSAATTSTPSASSPGQSERPHDWRPESIRAQLEASLRRLGTDHIDLYQLHNTRIEPILADDLWAELEKLRAEGKIRELGVALGPAIGWVEEGLAGDPQPADRVAADRVQHPRAGARTHVRGRARRRRGPRRPDLARPARVRHARRARSRRDTVFPKGDHRAHRNRDNMLDNFDKADTLTFLWEGTGRTIGQAAIAGILANPAFTTVLPTCVTVDEVREYAAASDAAAHRRRASPARRALARQLRRDQTATRCRSSRASERRRRRDHPPPRRATPPPAPRRRVRGVRRARLPRDVDGRRRRRRPGSRSRCSTSTSASKRALFVEVLDDVGHQLLAELAVATGVRAHRARAGRGRLRRLLPLRHRQRGRVPRPVRRVGPQRRGVRARSSSASSTRRPRPSAS